MSTHNNSTTLAYAIATHSATNASTTTTTAAATTVKDVNAHQHLHVSHLNTTTSQQHYGCKIGYAALRWTDVHMIRFMFCTNDQKDTLPLTAPLDVCVRGEKIPLAHILDTRHPFVRPPINILDATLTANGISFNHDNNDDGRHMFVKMLSYTHNVAKMIKTIQQMYGRWLLYGDAE